MPIDYSAIAAAGGIPKGTPTNLSKGWKQKAAAAALERCYEKVDERDDLRSWVSGRPLVKALPNLRLDPKKWLTRHHLSKRSKEKTRVADLHNVITVSAAEHELLDASALLPVDERGRQVADARKIHHFVWNRNLVPNDREPFRLPKLARRPHVETR